MQKKLSKQNNSGFTLSEVLIAVAILIVLMGLAMIPITRHQRDLRQTELDARAEIVYHAAQNKLSELLANGRISDCYAEDLQPLCAKLGEENTGKTLVAVTALEQVGLIAAAEKGGAKVWELVPTAGKKNLADAPILKCLEEM